MAHDSLRGRDRRHLRALGHSLKPVVTVGQKGRTGEVAAALGKALDAHELVKLRLQGGMGRDEKRAAAEEIADRAGAEVVSVVGHVALLFRRHPDPEKRKIDLPR